MFFRARMPPRFTMALLLPPLHAGVTRVYHTLMATLMLRCRASAAILSYMPLRLFSHIRYDNTPIFDALISYFSMHDMPAFRC